MPELTLGEIPGLNGELRDYQRRGVEWLDFLTAHGFGALLADDMGLGKTVQVIAWILSRRNVDLITLNGFYSNYKNILFYNK